jgi:hypothetical protein
MRPIFVTDLTMMAGAAAILFDPIFEGMAISLLFGALTSVTLTMLTLPLRCVAAKSAFMPESIEQEPEQALQLENGTPESGPAQPGGTQ